MNWESWSFPNGFPLQGTRLLAGEDVFSALDGVLERIGNLQRLVSTWTENLSEEDCQRGSSSSSSSLSTSSSQDSPGRGSSAASPCPSSPSPVHLEAQEEEEEEVKSQEEAHLNGEEPKTRSSQPRCRWESVQCHLRKMELNGLVMEHLIFHRSG